MPEQTLLPGFAPEPALTDRLFFAVMPDEAAAQRIAHLAAELRLRYGLRGRLLDTERLHVSLVGLGDHAGLPQSLIERACAAAQAVAVQPFMVCFDRALSFSGRGHAGGNRPFVLCGNTENAAGVGGMVSLHRALAMALRGAGLPGEPASGFTPHVTLLYDHASVADHAVQPPVTWGVREFVLLHSRIGLRQPYAVLRRWSLHASPV